MPFHMFCIYKYKSHVLDCALEIALCCDGINPYNMPVLSRTSLCANPTWRSAFGPHAPVVRTWRLGWVNVCSLVNGVQCHYCEGSSALVLPNTPSVTSVYSSWNIFHDSKEAGSATLDTGMQEPGDAEMGHFCYKHTCACE